MKATTRPAMAALLWRRAASLSLSVVVAGLSGEVVEPAWDSGEVAVVAVSDVVPFSWNIPGLTVGLWWCVVDVLDVLLLVDLEVLVDVGVGVGVDVGVVDVVEVEVDVGVVDVVDVVEVVDVVVDVVDVEVDVVLVVGAAVVVGSSEDEESSPPLPPEPS